MGILVADNTASLIMTAKVPIPTTEQLRLAQICADKNEDPNFIRERCKKVMEAAGCKESDAMLALHDSNNDIEAAVMILLDGKALQEGWQTTGKKTKKLNFNKDHSAILAKDSQYGDNSLSSSHVHLLNGGMAESSDSNTELNSRRGKGRGFAGDASAANETSSRRRSTPPTGDRQNRGGFSRGGRGRARGASAINDRPRSRERPYNEERPSNFSRRPLTRGSFNGSDRGGRGFTRGLNRKRKDNLDPAGYDGSISTWTNEAPDSNTWDSMATRWSAEGKSTDPLDSSCAESGGVVVDQWRPPSKSDTAVNDKRIPPISNGESGVWDNSMAREISSQPGNQLPSRGRGRGSFSGRYQRGYGRQNSRNDSLQHSAKRTNDSFAQQNSISEWNGTDEWDEEENWQQMRTRVFTNMKVQNQLAAAQVSSNKPSSTSPGVVSSGAAATAVGADSNSLEPSVSKSAQVRGESIDVNLLFNQKGMSSDASKGINSDQLSGSWSKQATDTLKNELGIGKSSLSGVEHANKVNVSTVSSRPFGSPRSFSSKVEMPCSLQTYGSHIDIEFGEFSSVNNKPIKAAEEQQNYFEFLAPTSIPINDRRGNETLVTGQGQQPLNGFFATNSSYADPSPVKQQPLTSTITVQQQPSSNLQCTSSNGPQHQLSGQQQHFLQQNTAERSPVTASSGVVTPKPTPQSLTPQQKTPQTGMISNVQQPPSQRSYGTATSSVSTTMNDSTGNVTVQVSKELPINLSTIPLPNAQSQVNAGGMAYSIPGAQKVTVTSSTSKPQMNTATIFNQVTANPSYQALAAAAMPYLYPDYLNATAFQFLSPAATGYPFGALPFDLSSLTLRDGTQGIADLKYPSSSREQSFNGGLQLPQQTSIQNGPSTASNIISGGASSSTGSLQQQQPQQSQQQQAPVASQLSLAPPPTGPLAAPPGLGLTPGSTLTDQQQAAAAAQLLAAAAPGAATATFPYQLMPAPYLTQFVVPSVTSASNVSAGGQYKNTGMFASQPMFYGGDIQQMAASQEYGKTMYGVNLAQTPQNPMGKPSTNSISMSISSSSADNKMYQHSQPLKSFDTKQFQQQNTATPPPGMAGPPGTYAPPNAYHQHHQATLNGTQGPQPGAYTTQYPPPQFMPSQLTHQQPVNVLTGASQGGPSLNPNEMLNSGLRMGNVAGGAKSNVNMYPTTGKYWAS